MANEKTSYFFIPVARRGLARGIKAAPTSGRLRVPSAFSLELQADRCDGGTDMPGLALPEVELYGPGDVVGFDERMIVRRDPQPNVSDFEPNCLPAVDFADADFPWRFTPDVAQAKGLTPWLTLIVLASDETANECSEREKIARSLPRIAANVTHLPDLKEAWRWAHVMVTGISEENLDSQHAVERGESDPDHIVSRVICSRHLMPSTRYTAYLVPTFESGRLAGLGESPSAAASATAFSWTVPPNASPPADPWVHLPYFAKWEFSTGARGDFEYLVRLLEPRVMYGLGKRDMVVVDPGFGVPSVKRSDSTESHTLSLEGALHSLDFVPTRWGQDENPPDAIDSSFRSALATKLNTPSVDALSTSAIAALPSGVLHASHSMSDPVLAPPIYGRWHAAQQVVSPKEDSWCDNLNLDPRHRAAAGYGAFVVQRLQESLMASAWKQLGAMEKMNALLRNAQVGREASTAVFRRFTRLAPGPFVRIMAPVSHKVRLVNASGATALSVSGALAASVLPKAALDRAFRRISRLRGPIRKRQLARPAAQATYRSLPDVLVRLGDSSLAAAGAAATKLTGIGDVTTAAFGKGHTYTPDGATSLAVRFSETDLTDATLDSAITGLRAAAPAVLGIWGGDQPKAQLAVKEALKWLQTPRRDPDNAAAAPLTQAVTSFKKALNPASSIAARLQKRMELNGVGKRADPLAPIMAAPEFPQPMYEPLRQISQDLVLPGLDSVPQNTVSLLQVNMRFIESYLCGCNHEMAAELLWREYPTDQRGSYFRQFFQVADAVDAGATGAGEPGAVLDSMKDITRLHKWGKTALGSHSNRSIPPTVLLVRGDLLRKYPNTVVYAVPARHGTQGRFPDLEGFTPEGVTASDDTVRKFPVISGSLRPDVTFFGFLLTEDQIRSGPSSEGYYFVLEERLSEARFGLDEAADMRPVPPAATARAITAWHDLAWSDLAGVAAGCCIDAATPAVTLPPSFSGPKWDKTAETSSASIASVLLQDPVRIAVHGDRMLPPKRR